MSKILRAVEPAAESLANRSWSDNLPLAIQLRNLRLELEISQEEFAALYHLPLAQLQVWENGEDADSLQGRLWLGMIRVDPRACEQLVTRAKPKS